MSYEIGQQVRLSATFDLGGVETDPTATTLRVRTPAGTTTVHIFGSSDMVRLGPGRFYFDLLLDKPKTYYYRWTGAGDVATSSGDEQIPVQGTIFTL